MQVTCRFTLYNSGGVTLHNATILGYNGTVGSLAPRQSFEWQQVYPITPEDVFQTYVNISASVVAYITQRGGAAPYFTNHTYNLWLPVQHVVDLRLLPSLEPPGEMQTWPDSASKGSQPEQVVGASQS